MEISKQQMCVCVRLYLNNLLPVLALTKTRLLFMEEALEISFQFITDVGYIRPRY